MGKIKDFFSLWFEEEFRGLVVLFLIVAALSVGVQSLLMWIGGLFPSVQDLGLMLDAILGFVLVFPIFFGSAMSNSEGEGEGNLFVGSLAIMGIYISVVWYFHAGIFVGCIVLLCSALWRLHKIGADPFWVLGGACAYLLYCIGAYFAMLFNGLEPAINLYGIITLIVVAVCIWFIPASE